MKIIKWIFFLSTVFIYVFNCKNVLATHIRAADLTGVRISRTQLTYRFTLTLYRDIHGIPAKDDGEFTFGIKGEKITGVAPQLIGSIPNSDTEIYRYEVEYTFPSPGTYNVGYFERNRNEFINNMDFSGETPFYVESIFLINPILDNNSSPILTIPPIDMGREGQKFIHNPGAYDPDGDSLAYKLTIPKQSESENVTNYRDPDNPEFSNSNELGNGAPTFDINPITGDLIWDSPSLPGEYNVAFFVYEYRNGVLISIINRDMQITIKDNNNNRPEIIIPKDTCIIAGNTLIDTITAMDIDNNLIIITRENRGAIFNLPSPRNSATFIQIQNNPGLAKGVFSWKTTCQDIRKEPYQAVFKAEDRPNPLENKLVDIKTWHIRVAAPPPNLIQADVDVNIRTVMLGWDPYFCQNAERMTIWRRIGNFDYTLNACQTGLPQQANYQQIGEVPISQNNFIDRTAKRGINYCYRIYAKFPEPGGGESVASQEQCIFIPSLAPYIIKVDVSKTDKIQGEIALEWTISKEAALLSKPITYQLRRSTESQGTSPVVIATFQEKDTTYIDDNLNTEEESYRYDLIIFSQNNAADTSSAASSVFLRGKSSNKVRLTWDTEVPWSNQSTDYPYHYVYRERQPRDGILILMDSAKVTESGLSYVDDGTVPGFSLIERQIYCYRVTTVGTYNNIDIKEPLINRSQEACLYVLDTIPPCPPILNIAIEECSPGLIESRREESSCNFDTFKNDLSWKKDDDKNCDMDIEFYNIYYTTKREQPYELLEENLNNTSFIHDNLNSLAGCYYITAIDSSSNESDPSNIVCVENCPDFYMPNVFTPNNDGINDLLKPICRLFVENIDFTVVNRWGEFMYNITDNIDIEWDGKDSRGNQVAEGIYYYSAVVKYKLLDERNNVTFRGVIHLIR